MDYCTLFPEGWWAHCCEAHDAAYAAQVARDMADTALMQCIAVSAPYPVLSGASVLIGLVVFAGVRVFGNYFYRKANSGNKPKSN